MERKDHGLWVEKYRPQNLESFVGNEHLKEQLQSFIEKGDLVNMLFYGSAGCGKTSLAKLLVSNLDCEYMIINASDERGIDTIREKIKGFASSASFKPLKVIILDEADQILISAQSALKNIIETFSLDTRFILTCNHLDRIIDPIQSRCQTIKVFPPSKSLVAKHIVGILKEENVNFNLDDLAKVINSFYPDLRKCLNVLQLNIKDNTLKLEGEIFTSQEYINQIIKELSKSKPSYNVLRQIIADSNLNEFEGLYRALFDRAPEYIPGSEGSVALILNEHSYQANFRIDKEINISSCLFSITKLKNK